MAWISLLVGGMIGTGLRYLISSNSQEWFGNQFPYGTAIVNLLGCLLIGLFVVLTEQKISLGDHIRLFLIVGFCGAFTTFSTFILDTVHLIRAGESLKAFMNVAGSVALGFIAFRIGIFLGDLI